MSTAQNPSPDTRDHSANERVREALADHAGSTTTELAEVTGLGKSTVGKVLAALEAAGQARRDTPPVEGGGRRPAARWSPPTPSGPATDDNAPRGGHRGARGTAGDQGPVEAASGERLRPGQLGTLVLEYLVAHAQEHVGPTALGKTLNRSSGAVANLCGSSLSSATVAEVAMGVGASTSAVARALAELEREGRVVRASGGRERGPAAAGRLDCERHDVGVRDREAAAGSR